MSGKDAHAASQTIAANPDFTGTTAQLQRLDQIALDVSKTFNEDLTKASETVAAAISDPAQEAQALADKHFPAMSQALANTVKDLEAAGDKAGATNVVLQALATGAAGATERITPLQKALDSLHGSFERPLADGKSLADDLGTFSTNVAVAAIDALSQSLKDFGAVWDQLHGRASGPVSTDATSIAGVAQTGSVLGTSITNGLFNLGLINGHNPGGATIGHGAASLIQDDAAQRGFAPDSMFSKLAVSIGAQESQGQQFDKNGGVLTSSAGALGLMQVMPSNAHGNDLTSTSGNVNAGVTLLSHLWTKYNGDLQVIAAAYNWGEGNVDQFLAVGGSLPTGVANYVQSVTGKPLGGVYGPTSAGAAKAAASAPPTGAGSQFGITNTTADIQNAADKKAASSPDISQQRDDLTNEIAMYTKASDATHDYSGQIEMLKGKLADLLDPQAKITRGLTDQLAPLNTAAGYTRTLAEVQNQFALAARSAGQAVNDNDLSAAEAAKAKELVLSYDDATAALNRKLAAETASLPLYEQGGVAIQHATDQQTAYADALNNFAAGSPAFVTAVAARTQALDALNTVTEQQKVAQQVGANDEQLKVIAAETAGHAALVVQMQAEYDMHQKFGAVLPIEAQKYVETTVAVAAQTKAYDEQKQASQQLQSEFTSIADTIGNDITQAFVQSSGAGLKFSSILAGIETQVVTMIAKLALVDPILNSVFGGSAPTLTTLTQFLNKQTAGTPAGSGFASNALSGLGNVISNPLSGGSVLPGLDNLVQANFGFGAAQITNPQAYAALPANTPGPVLPGPAPGAAGLLNGTGNVFGGFGSFTNDLGILGAAAPGIASGNIAQSIAGAGGAAIGTAILPGIGTAIGGIAGNLLGGLFSGPPKSKYTDQQVDVSNGTLSLGKEVNQAEDGSQYVNEAKVLIASVNGLLTADKVSLVNRSGVLGSIGDMSINGATTNPADLLKDLRFHAGSDGSANLAGILNTTVSGQSFSSLTDLNTALMTARTFASILDAAGVAAKGFTKDLSAFNITKVNSGNAQVDTALKTDLTRQTFSSAQALQNEINVVETFVKSTMPDLLKETVDGTSSFQSSMDSLRTTFGNAEAQAKSYGLSVDALTSQEATLESQSYAKQMTTLRQSDAGVQATTIGLSGDKQTADEWNLSITDAQQSLALANAWEAVYGAAYSSMKEYQNNVVDLAKEQNAQLLLVQKENSSAVASTISSLVDYAKGLATSAESALAPVTQYQDAKANFGSIASAAEGGDSIALGKLQSAADTLLQASKTVNGGGFNYTQDYTAVQDVLGQIGNTPTDTLTNAYVGAQVQDLKDSLVYQLQQLQGQVGSLKSELAQSNRLTLTAAAA